MDLLRHLRYFLAVCEERHFGRAAERLGMAQPPLSQRVKRLEDELGVRLFDRDPRGVRLTAAGRALREEATALLARAERAVDRTRRAHAGEIGVLRAGVPADLPGRVLAAIVDAFAVRRPELGLDLQELGTGEQLRLLAERELDAGLLRLPADLAGHDVLAEPVQPLGVVLPRESPLAARAELALSDLDGLDLVARPRASAPGFHDEVLAVCREHGFVPGRVHHAQNPEFMLGLVLSGRGVCFDTGEVARKEARAVWRPITGGVLVARSAVVAPAGHAHPASVDFAAAVTEALSGPPAPTREQAPVRPWDAVYGE
ncbi:LysR family transcriptional regulator [Actinorhabdospora filicis]|uniref:LysR family transcriptional regulator n=1 Tax=Actinorhabdospora filicis TaxID=1785913 RepID=A0A9W6W957_9ACTN|nr:LysR substrate-binding domain-containing protein [Actinorhabdospora filicis]GLZ78229.1 LysR family transcriptional regulator [Actinorhabdospora filicis]